jgi:hypothetical protein
MRSGSLNQFVEVYRMVDRQSETGAMTKEKMLLICLRCNLLKQQSAFVVEAGEEDDKVRLVFETWLNEEVRDTDTLLWCKQEFKITLLEYNYPNRTMRIHCTKINK